METNHISQSPFDLETLIKGLKTEDARNLKLMLNMQAVMWGIAALYVFIFAVKFIMTTPWYNKFGAFLVMVAFVVFALLFRNYYKEYKSIDYGIPTMEMLEKAACRYGLFQWRGLYMLAPLILEGIGLNLMMYDDFTNFDPIYRILIFQTSYFFLLTVGFLIGFIIWKRSKKPLRDHALALLKEIES
jgi:hypothetical protein